MVTLKHPAFGDRVTREVESDDVARWVAQGWVDPRPQRRKKKADPEPAPETPSVGDDEE